MSVMGLAKVVDGRSSLVTTEIFRVILSTICLGICGKENNNNLKTTETKKHKSRVVCWKYANKCSLPEKRMFDWWVGGTLFQSLFSHFQNSNSRFRLYKSIIFNSCTYWYLGVHSCGGNCETTGYCEHCVCVSKPVTNFYCQCRCLFALEKIDEQEQVCLLTL